MKKLIAVVFLSACATQPQQPTEAQKAVLAYYADICTRKGVNPDNRDAMRGCIWNTYQRDVHAGVYGGGPSVLQALGSVYSAQGRQGYCDTYRTLSGWTTTCY